MQNAVIQAKEVNQLRQAGLSSMYGDVCLELVQSSLGTAPPLVNQDLELQYVVLKTQATDESHFSRH